MSCVSLCLSETSSLQTVSSDHSNRNIQLYCYAPSLTDRVPPPPDFLGRTEIRLAEIKKDQGSKGPITKRLLLHEVPTGEIVVRLDLQLFEEP